MKQRELIFMEGIVYVPLTQGLYALIDPQDVAMIEGRNWHAYRTENNWYAATMLRSSIDGHRRRITLHRMLMSPVGNFHVDHVNCNGLDNRRNNLRIANYTQNSCNRRRASNNASGYKGVSFKKRENKWEAKIMIDRRSVFLGVHASPELAYSSYVEASSRLHGEFGRVE